MKRIAALLLALVWALALTACGGQGGLPPSLPAETAGASQPASEQPSAAVPDTPAPSPAEDTPAPSPAEETPAPPPAEETAPQESEEVSQAPELDEDGFYHTRDEVALYIHLYGRLPDNYVTKQKAQDLGWTGGSVERWAGEGTAIGGSRFGNYEGLLPEKKGRTYQECDIDTVGTSSRGAKRIVFSNDGLIYYTEDHYQSFELLYGEP